MGQRQLEGSRAAPWPRWPWDPPMSPCRQLGWQQGQGDKQRQRNNRDSRDRGTTGTSGSIQPDRAAASCPTCPQLCSWGPQSGDTQGTPHQLPIPAAPAMGRAGSSLRSPLGTPTLVTTSPGSCCPCPGCPRGHVPAPKRWERGFSGHPWEIVPVQPARSRGWGFPAGVPPPAEGTPPPFYPPRKSHYKMNAQTLPMSTFHHCREIWKKGRKQQICSNSCAGAPAEDVP